MNHQQRERARQRLLQLRERADALLEAPDDVTPEFEDWVAEVKRALTLGLGDEHSLVREFDVLTMVHVAYGSRTGLRGPFERHEQRERPHRVLRRGQGLIEDAVAVLPSVPAAAAEESLPGGEIREVNGVSVAVAPGSPGTTTPAGGHPKAFLSYAWEGEELQDWVLALAVELRTRRGVDVILDRWQVHPGDQLPAFMETAVREADFVVIVCTPTYKAKSENRAGGVGYEGHIMTAELFQRNNQRKFIPVIRLGEHTSAMPGWLAGKKALDLRGAWPGKDFQTLVDTLHGRLPVAPPIGGEADDGDATRAGASSAADADSLPATGSGQPRAHAEGDRSIAIGGNVSNSRVSTGDSKKNR